MTPDLIVLSSLAIGCAAGGICTLLPRVAVLALVGVCVPVLGVGFSMVFC